MLKKYDSIFNGLSLSKFLRFIYISQSDSALYESSIVITAQIFSEQQGFS